MESFVNRIKEAGRASGVRVTLRYWVHIVIASRGRAKRQNIALQYTRRRPARGRAAGRGLSSHGPVPGPSWRGAAVRLYGALQYLYTLPLYTLQLPGQQEVR